MVFFLIRLAVNALAIALTSWLLPGITVVDNRIVVYLLLALGFGLLNTFVRPLVLLFTGRFVIVTMGFFVLVVNGFMLGLLGLFLGHWITVSSFFSAMLGGLIMALIATVFEAILGLSPPIEADTSGQRVEWYGLDRLYYGRRNRIVENLRVQQVYQTLWRYGLDIAFDKSPFADFRRTMQRRFYRITGQQPDLSIPAKVRLMLQELGPIYVKMGQIVSSQAQYLPADWSGELAKLQSNVPPFPAAEARDIVIKELGAPPEELFAEFAVEPFAAASTAQVHRATLHSGEVVVVKIQRPNILPQVKADLGIMLDFAEVLERRTSWAASYNLVEMLDEFGKHVIDELDYQNEAYNAMRLARVLAVYEGIHVPTVYSHYTSPKVLTMEFVQGVKINQVERIRAAGIDCAQLAELFVKSMVKQLLIDGFFHGDPHPGNVLVNLETGVIQLLDMGMVGYLDTAQKMNLGDLVLTLYTGDIRDLGRVLLSLSTPFKPVDEKAFVQALGRRVGRYFEFADESSSFAAVMSETLALMMEYGLRLNSELTVAVKAMIQAEEAALTLDPSVDLLEIAYREASSLLVQQVSVDNVVDLIKKEGMRSLKETVRRIPSLTNATMRWLDQYESGKLIVHVDTSDLARQVGQFSIAVRYLTLAFVLAGMVIGTALAASLTGAEAWQFWPWVARTLFTISIFISVYLVWTVVRQLGEE